MDKIIDEDRNIEQDKKKLKLKIKKLQLSLKVLKDKFKKQANLIKLAPKEKISHILYRNTLLVQETLNRIDQVKLNILKDIDEIKKCESEVKKKQINSEINEKQIICYVLLRQMTDLFENYSIFDFDYEIICLSDEHKDKVLAYTPSLYHEVVLHEISQIKPKSEIPQTKNDEKIIEPFVGSALKGVVDGLMQGLDAIKQGVNSVGVFVEDMLDAVVDAFEQMFDVLGEIFNKMVEIVNFVVGIIFDVIDIFFKVLKFIYQLITRWIPAFVKKCVSYFEEMWSRLDIFLFVFLLKFVTDVFLTRISSKISEGLDEAVSLMNLSEFFSFYLFWMYPKTIRNLKNYLINFMIDLVIFLGRGIAISTEDIANTLSGAPNDVRNAVLRFRFIPKWLISWYKDVSPIIDFDFGSFAGKNVKQEDRIINFVSWFSEYGPLFVYKTFMLYALVHIIIYLAYPHLEFGILTLRELSLAPIVALVDFKELMVSGKFPSTAV